MAEKQIKQNGVIWFDKTGLSVYLENKPFIRLNFTSDVFSNLEFTDKIKLENLIRTFIKQNNLYYLSFILILTPDVLFEKDLSSTNSEGQSKEENDFIDNVPFENILSHTWIKDNKKKLIVTNREYILFLNEVFEKDNGRLVAAFPYSLFGANIRNETVREIWKKLSIFKQDNLYDIKNELPTFRANEIFEKNKKTDQSLMPVLVVIFIVLIGLLGYLMVRK